MSSCVKPFIGVIFYGRYLLKKILYRNLLLSFGSVTAIKNVWSISDYIITICLTESFIIKCKRYEKWKIWERILYHLLSSNVKKKVIRHQISERLFLLVFSKTFSVRKRQNFSHFFLRYSSVNFFWYGYFDTALADRDRLNERGRLI